MGCAPLFSVTKASLLGGPFRGEASAGVVVYANEVSRGSALPKGVQIPAGAGDKGWQQVPFLDSFVSFL